MAVLIILLAILVLIVIVPVLMGVLVYKDAKTRNMNPLLWVLVVLFVPGFIGLIIYLIARTWHPDRKCPHCNANVSEYYNVCPECGKPLKSKCNNCGKFLEAGWKVCPNCGTAIPEENIIPVSKKRGKGFSVAAIVCIILIPVLLCVILLAAVMGIRSLSSDGYGMTYAKFVAVDDEFCELYPGFAKWYNECQDSDDGIYVLSIPHPEMEAYTYVIYTSEFNSDVDIDYDFLDRSVFRNARLTVRFNEKISETNVNCSLLSVVEIYYDEECDVAVEVNGEDASYTLSAYDGYETLTIDEFIDYGEVLESGYTTPAD